MSLKNLDINQIAEDIAEIMYNNPDVWGSSDYNISINKKNGNVDLDHNTRCYAECCANFDPILISLYDFNGDGWIEIDDDGDYHPIGELDEWIGSEMFYDAAYNAINNLDEEDE